MNNLQPFEKHLADQLQQTPVPNREEGWVEMRKLLDRELPEGGTGWSGNRKWWWMGITVAIIISGLWMREEFYKKESNAVAQKDVINKENETDKIVPSTHQSTDKTNNNNSITSVHSKEQGSNIPTSGEANKLDHTRKTSLTTVPASNNQTNSEAGILENKNNTAQHNDINSTATSSTLNSKIRKERNNTILVGATTGVVATSAAKGNGHLKAQHGGTELVQKNNGIAEDGITKDGASENESRELFATSNIPSTSNAEELFIDPAHELGSAPSITHQLQLDPSKTDKAFLNQLRKQSIKADNRKMSARSMRGDSREKDNELTFAAGLALPQSFAISNQQAPAYGVNANASRVSDYLPVPFFQYHMNSKVFLQTELQFQSPQYTDRLLVYQGQQYTTPSTMLEKNVFIEKLYYFHIPFNVYFSPARNFYVGSGIQFSSLLSGVATYQYNQYSNAALQNSTSKVQGFKDDSIASKLSSSEWRYQFDANYYLKRFTFGARYNQALSQFINLQPSPTLPYTIGRNQSFFIYLRYNIWEERKKNSFYSE